MTFSFVILDRVISQVVSAINWYENEGVDIADRFWDEFNRTSRLIHQYPYAFRYRYNRVRIAPVSGFPYIICYEIIGDEIVVFKLIHVNEDERKRKSTSK
jgi:hypothetical protein